MKKKMRLLLILEKNKVCVRKKIINSIFIIMIMWIIDYCVNKNCNIVILRWWSGGKWTRWDKRGILLIV